MARLLLNHFMAVVYGAGLLWLLLAVAGANATETTFRHRYNATVFFPEGWGFFTRSPREEKCVAYRLLPTGELAPVFRKNGAAQNWFGLSRESRRLNMEMAQLRAGARPEAGWVTVADQAAALARARLPAAGTDTVAFDPRKFHLLRRGTYVLKRYRVPAWSWARYPQHFTPRASLKKVVLL